DAEPRGRAHRHQRILPGRRGDARGGGQPGGGYGPARPRRPAAALRRPAGRRRPRRRAARPHPAEVARGTLAAALPRRALPDRGDPAHPERQEARGAGQAHPGRDAARDRGQPGRDEQPGEPAGLHRPGPGADERIADRVGRGYGIAEGRAFARCVSRRSRVCVQPASIPWRYGAASAVDVTMRALTVSVVLPPCSAKVTVVSTSKSGLPALSRAALVKTSRSGATTSRYTPVIG